MNTTHDLRLRHMYRAFSAGGRIDFLTGDIVGSFRDHDFSPVCAALGG